MPGSAESPRRRPGRGILHAVLLVLAATVLHASLCEWREVEYDATRAAEVEGRVLWTVRRVAHPSGNAAAFDARKASLRVYHADWLACWQSEAEAAGAGDACREVLASGADATTRAIRLAECEARNAPGVSRRPGFQRCLAARGRPDAPAPHWTRDVFGKRFAGPYWSLTALFAEDLGGRPATSRVVGLLGGIALPALLCAIAFSGLPLPFAPADRR